MMSALGQKQTCASQNVMSALPLKADIRRGVRGSPIETGFYNSGELLIFA
jgi:hypothetical protein